VGYVVVMGRAMATSQDFVNWVCSPALEPDYLNYVLFGERDSLLRFASGTTHQTIYYPEAKAFHLLLPPPGEQRAIVRILGALDDKIELNRRMNETLEELARSIFKSWFVDFDPVRAKAEGRQPVGMDAETAAMFPDQLDQSKLGDAPRGWSVRSLYDSATYINGAAYRDFHFCDPADGLPIIKIAELKSGVTEQTRFTNTVLHERYRLDSGDILFSWSGNPDTSIDTFVWTHGPAWLNQHIFKVVPHVPEERVFIFRLLRHLRPVFAEIARDKQTTGLGHVTAADMKRLWVVSPSRDILVAANRVLGPLYDRWFASTNESQSIAELRDLLLPKLISGELRIKDAEKLAEAAL
jgi:type I restriction enzyme S subunit